MCINISPQLLDLGFISKANFDATADPESKFSMDQYHIEKVTELESWTSLVHEQP